MVLERGSATPEVALDRTRVAAVRAKVARPRGATFENVGVRVTGEIPGSEPPGVQVVGPDTMDRAPAGVRAVRPDGTFEVRVPGDRDVVLEAWHPYLRSSGVVTLREPRGDVVLRLVPGPTTTIAFAEGLTPELVLQATRNVLLLRSRPAGEPALAVYPVGAGREVRFGGYEPGRYAVWIDGGSMAPKTLRDVVLGEGDTRIDAVALEPGSPLRIGLRRASADTAGGMLFVEAVHQGEPRYVRAWAGEAGTRAVTLAGLGALHLRVKVERPSPAGHMEVLLDREVEADGWSELALPLDLR